MFSLGVDNVHATKRWYIATLYSTKILKLWRNEHRVLSIPCFMLVNERIGMYCLFENWASDLKKVAPDEESLGYSDALQACGDVDYWRRGNGKYVPVKLLLTIERPRGAR